MQNKTDWQDLILGGEDDERRRICADNSGPLD
jgi:hypothetical protein